MLTLPVGESTRTSILADDSFADTVNSLSLMLTPKAKVHDDDDVCCGDWMGTPSTTCSTRSASKESASFGFGFGFEDEEDEAELISSSLTAPAAKETMIFVDWDDTLFPTSWLDTKPLFKAWWRGAAEARDVLEAADRAELEALDRAAVGMLTAMSHRGKVCCVTLAKPSWHLRTMEAFMPLVAAAWHELSVETFYASSEQVAQELVSGGGWASVAEDESERDQLNCQLRMRQKQRSMTKALRQFYGRGGAWRHALSVGDGVFERLALQEIGFKCSASSDDTPFLVKTVKLREDPTCVEMHDALMDLQAVFPAMAAWSTDLDLDVSHLGLDLVMETHQCLLEASV